MKRILITLAMAASGLAQADTTQPPKVYMEVAAAPANAREAEIAGLFDRWNAALASGDAEQVTRLYAPDGVLEPTVSNEVRSTPAGIKDYFVKFLKMQPAGTINYRQIRLLGADAALDTGVYTFKLTKDGKPQQVQARYTYVYKKVDGAWKILNHHSSAMPEAVAK
ncbi:SgcJ/EcaC family oxidoreductase [Duganella sp. HH101]|uniref:SgcJ/EcaC family oxidoreductase n=1 Tax=Duganella sp. HH101 TaxID=1781066 RepID=UPI00087355B8|nr:SgcJ/EcaC family oxidoreductase [Duganella sp. HH101]OFA03659.1 calcium/calmodulin dependent protein kinase II association [Duganella sp. HH101]